MAVIAKYKANHFTPVAEDNINGSFVERVLRAALLFLPIWWIAGLKLILVPGLALILAFYLMVVQCYQDRAVKAPRSTYFLIAYSILYTASLLVAWLLHPSDRVVASALNLSYWISGLIIIFAVYNSRANVEAFKSLVKAAFLIGALNFLITVFTQVAWFLGVETLRLPTLVGTVLPTGLLSRYRLLYDSLVPALSLNGWTAFGFLPRATSFFTYPTSLGAFSAALVPLIIGARQMGWLSRPIFLGLMMSQVYTLVASLSRFSVLALLLALVAGSILTTQQPVRRLGLSVVAIGALAIVLMSGSLESAIAGFHSFRQGSSDNRFAVYTETVEQVINNRMILIGHGIKPREDPNEVVVASHSTFLGSMYKSGLVGAVFLALFWLGVTAKWVHAVRRIANGPWRDIVRMLGVSNLVVIMWQFQGDIDASDILCLFTFAMTAYLLKFCTIGLATGADIKPARNDVMFGAASPISVDTGVSE